MWGPAATTIVVSNSDVTTVPWVPESGVVVLGTPVGYPGGDAFALDHWDRINSRLDTTIQTVTSIADAQLAHHLLRHCLDGCKVNHLLRA